MKIQCRSTPSPGNGKAKENPARARRVARKEKKATQAMVTETRQQNTRDLRVSVEIAENTDTKLLIVGTSSHPNLNLRDKGTGKSKSKVTEFIESDSSRQVEETWTSNTSAPQPSLSQVNTTGCADEGTLDILASRQQETSVHSELGRSVLQQD